MEEAKLHLSRVKHCLCLGYNVYIVIFYTTGEKNLTDCQLFEQIILKGTYRQTKKQSYIGPSKMTLTKMLIYFSTFI
jgi:hypothetical protein